MSMSRRLFLTGATVSIATFGRFGFCEQEGPYADSALADAWLKKARLQLGSVSGTLTLGRFADPTYFLRKPISWNPNEGQTPKPVQVPIGFVTDFASIPRAFWTLLPPDGRYTYAAIIHDFLYWDQSIGRDEADLVLKYAMQDFNVDAATVVAIYSGVRLGGEGPWQDNAKLKHSGERRILKVWPKDDDAPTLSWDDWKKKPGVFA